MQTVAACPHLVRLPVYCPQCHILETLLFYKRQLVNNRKWRQGRGGQIYHCALPCKRLSMN